MMDRSGIPEITKDPMSLLFESGCNTGNEDGRQENCDGDPHGYFTTKDDGMCS